VQDKKLLQREQKPGTSAVLTTAAYTVVLAIGLLISHSWHGACSGCRRRFREGRPKPPAEVTPTQRPRESAAAPV